MYIGDYEIKFHKYNGYHYADIYLASGGYCIVQHKDKDKKKAKQLALNWIDKYVQFTDKQSIISN